VAALLAFAPDAGFPAALPWGALPRCSPPHPDDAPVRVRWWIMLPVCIVGVVLSDGLLYGMGRFFGPRLLQHRFMARLVPPDKRAKIERNFHRYGVKILLFARLLPGIRSPIFITAGIMRLPFRSFLLADGIYAIPGVSLLFFLSYWFTTSFKDLVERAEAKVLQVRPILILAAIVAVGIYFLVNFLRRPVSTGDPEELPLIGPQVAARIDSDPNVVRPPFPPEGARQEDRGKKVEGRG
jgi:membrane protein DedA with SNARE-associated domain